MDKNTFMFGMNITEEFIQKKNNLHAWNHLRNDDFDVLFLRVSVILILFAISLGLMTVLRMIYVMYRMSSKKDLSQWFSDRNSYPNLIKKYLYLLSWMILIDTLIAKVIHNICIYWFSIHFKYFIIVIDCFKNVLLSLLLKNSLCCCKNLKFPTKFQEFMEFFIFSLYHLPIAFCSLIFGSNLNFYVIVCFIFTFMLWLRMNCKISKLSTIIGFIYCISQSFNFVTIIINFFIISYSALFKMSIDLCLSIMFNLIFSFLAVKIFNESDYDQTITPIQVKNIK